MPKRTASPPAGGKALLTAPVRRPSPRSEVEAAVRAGGRPLDGSVRDGFEASFQHDFSGVRVHTDGRAAQSADSLGARAYTFGRHIVFGAGGFRPSEPVGRHLLAHELAHVVQHDRSPGAAPPSTVSDPGSAAERRAGRAADAAMAGRAIPALGAASAGVVHRVPVETNGGTFDTTRYAAVNVGAGVGKRVGADIALEFTPNSLVEADTIGLTQTVTTLRSTAAGGPVDTPNPPSARKRSISLVPGEGGEVGRAIDQGDPGDADTIPNTNPLYAVENTPGNISATLTDVPAIGGAFRHGFRRRNGATFDVQSARISDRPQRAITFVGQEYRQTFEATALVLDGPMRDTYLGSIEWGWRADAAGNATLDPDPIRLVRPGVPTSDFFVAAEKWNAARFTDPTTGTVHDTVDLPIVQRPEHFGSVPAADRPTRLLLLWLDLVDIELQSLPAGPTRTNKLFEKRALEAELRNRSIMVEVNVKKTEDWLGADEVYVKVATSGRSVQTPSRDINDGGFETYQIPLSTLLPIEGPISVEVFDEDLGVFFDRDDLIVTMTWTSPFPDARNTESLDEADYDVNVRFDR